MSPIQLFALSIPGVYFNSVLIVWFITIFSIHGFIFSPVRAFKTMKPVMKAFLYGFIPGALISNIIAFNMETANILAMLPVVFGVAVSAFVLHKELFRISSNPRKTVMYVAVFFVLMTLLFGWSAFSLQHSDLT
ncbi:hypothetical protein [Ruegeria sp.]|uniref:hypothetical protein n=1 Tax=Ruegeria sp. TaxID=1879320 RepID=UPI002323A337|nr:hypothetical protein [Ruegeria sp.]MDA7963858.1 hypothetical protein [Ruegeria sp.]